MAGDLGTGSYEATDEVTGQGVKSGAGYCCKSQVGSSIDVLDLERLPLACALRARNQPGKVGKNIRMGSQEKGRGSP